MATCIGGVMFATAVMAAPSGYLRKLGPVPIRFQSVIVPVAAVALPPLVTQEKPAENPLPAAATPVSNAKASTNDVASAKETASPLTSSPTNIITISSVQDPMAAPRAGSFGSDLPKVIEMLMPTPGATNAPGNKLVVMPSVPFTPPLPFQTAPSSATYSSPPDEPIKTP